MTFREDESRLRERNLRENFAWLNRFALSLLKQHPGRQSLVMKRRSCGWSDAFLMEIATSTVSGRHRNTNRLMSRVYEEFARQGA